MVLDPRDFPGLDARETVRAQELADAGAYSVEQVVDALRVATREGGRVDEILARNKTVAEALKDPERRAGPYACVSLLGRGGMGEVWKAWDTELGRWVAVKRLLHLGPEDVARFRREARAVAGLSHPNIAAVFGSGEEAGRPWLAMQLVSGRALDGAGPMPPREAAAILRDAALAIDHAHERGIIHRDVKPGNLMIGDDRRVCVLDFGLARTLAPGQTLSQDGVVMGTPAYMAPEQARGDVARVGRRTDVYALGATLYHLLTGRAPFAAPHVGDLLMKVLDEDPRPPRKIAPAVDRDLEAIVLKCLEKDPERRYAGARELADDLSRHLAAEAVTARAPSAFYRVRKALARRRRVIAAGAAGLALAAALLVPPLLGARGDAASNKRLTSLWTQVLVARQGVYIGGEDPARVRAGLRAAVEPISAFIAARPKHPPGYYVRARARLTLDDPEGAEADLRRAVELDPGFALAQGLLARVLLERYAFERYKPVDAASKKDRDRRIAPLLEEARDRAARRSAVDDRWGLPRTPEDEVSETLLRALSAAYLDGRRDEAARILEEARAAAPHEDYPLWLSYVGGDDHEAHVRLQTEALSRRPHYAAALLARSTCLAFLGRRDEAVRDLDRALEEHPDSYRGHFLRAKLRGPEGMKDADRAVELGATNPEAWGLRGFLRFSADDLAGAAEDLRRALELAPDLCEALGLSAAIRLKRGDLDGALREGARAVELDPDYGEAWSTLGLARLLKGEPDAAIADFDRALAARPGEAKILHNRGRARAAKGDTAGAVEDYSREIEADPGRVPGRIERARARVALKDYAKAEADLDAAIRLDPKAATAWDLRAEIKALRKDLQGALADAEEGLRHSPGSYTLRGTRGLLKVAAGDRPGAIEDLERALRDAPPDWARRASLERVLRATPGPR